MSTYKPAKTLDEQIKYLKENKRVCFNTIDERHAKDILFKYNYINIITPFKHHFAKLSNKKEVIKEMEIMYMKEMQNLVNIMNYTKMNVKIILSFQKISFSLKLYLNQYFLTEY